MVFSPTLLLTVTLERGPDDRDELHLHAGGQGFWVARMIRNLGLRSVLCSPVGGESGRVLRCLAEAEGVHLDPVPVRGANGAYVHDRRAGCRESLASIPGAQLARHEADDLYEAGLVTGLEARTAVLTGQLWPVLPTDHYRRLAMDLRANGCRVVADVSGPVLQPVLSGGVDVLKISSEELVRDGLVDGEDDDRVTVVMAELMASGAESVIVSRAAEPALVCRGSRLWKVVIPRFEPADFRGSGDSMTAGLAVGIARGMEIESAVRLAAAAGSLNVTRHGLGTGSRAQIERLMPFVSVQEIRGRIQQVRTE
jgi:1-phosphofructokinase